MTPAETYLQARDRLIAQRSDYETAYRDFRWPHFEEFNWALDYFDRYAEGNERPALRVVSESGEVEEYSYAAMSRRSPFVS